MKKWKTLSSTLVFDNKWFPIFKEVVELPNGKIIDDYYLWKKFDVAMVVPLTKKNKMILVKQYKHGSKEIMIEFPAGYADKNESIENCAKRELLEETGYETEKLDLLGKLVSDPTKAMGITEVYLAQNAVKVSDQHLDENENIEILEVEIKKVLKMIYSGIICAPSTIASMFLVLKRIGYKV